MWQKEFGTEYDVPVTIQTLVRQSVLVDASYHNDTSPTFMFDDNMCALWVEHPDPTQREAPGPRFTIVTRANVVFQTDDEYRIVQFIADYLKDKGVIVSEKGNT